MSGSPFHLRDKILVLRLFRLGKLPPGLYSSEILVENGFPLLVLEYGNLSEPQTKVEGSLPRLRWASPWAAWLPQRVRSAAIWLGMLARLCFKLAREGRPRLLIAHGPQEQAAAYLCSLIFRFPFAVHVHEGTESTEKLTPFNRVLLRVEGIVLRRASFLIFPEASRARLFRERYRLTGPIFVVFNTPRLRARGPGLDLRKALGLPTNAMLMAYFGGIGPTNLIDEAVAALSGLPNLHFLVWGWGDESYLTLLKQTAERNHVEARLHLMGEVEDKWQNLESCDVGYCVYRPDTFRTRHMGTASNKFTECLAAGIPMLTSGNDDFKQLVTTLEVGVCAPDLTVAGIRDGLHFLIYDRFGLQRKAQKGLAAHRTQFHYEHQFAPVLAFLRQRFAPSELERGTDRPAIAPQKIAKSGME